MKLDVEKLSEAELVDLNNRIVERLRFLREMRTHGQMLEFRVGDRVSFHPDGRLVLIGMLTRYNKKTVTVITEQGEHWNVALAKDGHIGEEPTPGNQRCPATEEISEAILTL